MGSVQGATFKLAELLLQQQKLSSVSYRKQPKAGGREQSAEDKQPRAGSREQEAEGGEPRESTQWTSGEESWRRRKLAARKTGGEKGWRRRRLAAKKAAGVEGWQHKCWRRGKLAACKADAAAARAHTLRSASLFPPPAKISSLFFFARVRKRNEKAEIPH